MRVVQVVAAVAVLLSFPGTAFASVPGGQSAPGTSARPVLSTAEARPFSAANYLRWSGTYAAPTEDPWHPGRIRVPHRADFVVGARYATVQQAVNAAYTAGGTSRRYIKVLPGTYTGTVFIPAGSPPLTLYGAGRPEDVRLEFTLDATATPSTRRAGCGRPAPSSRRWRRPT